MVDSTNDLLAERLRPVLLRLARRIRRESQTAALGAVQVSILAAIEADPGVTAAQLAPREQMSPPAMSRHVAALEDAGLVMRARAVGQRRAPLDLTPEGLTTLRSVQSERTAWLSTRLVGLAAADRRAIESALRPLQALLEADPP
jgi:DNA-binding MarR family transcriptional regulator